MLLRTTMIKSLTEEMIKLFDSANLHFFIGGSRRFGYSDDMSDTDMYVHIPFDSTTIDNGKYDNIIDTFTAMGMEVSYESADYGGNAYRFMDLLHVVVLVSEIGFYDLKADHDDLQEYFDNNPVMVNIAKAMKNQGINGSTVFRVFIDVIRNEAHL